MNGAVERLRQVVTGPGLAVRLPGTGGQTPAGCAALLRAAIAPGTPMPFGETLTFGGGVTGGIVILAAQTRLAGSATGVGIPCLIRNTTPAVTVVGILLIDANKLTTSLDSLNGLPDIGVITAQDREIVLRETILHEMAHTLGIGTMWDRTRGMEPPLLVMTNPVLPGYRGAQAWQGWQSVGGAPQAGNLVPVEGQAGSGANFGHWRESLGRRELMTPFLSLPNPARGFTTVANPLSAITVGAFADLGYTVNAGAADFFDLTTPAIPPTNRSPVAGPTRSVPLRIVEPQLPLIIPVRLAPVFSSPPML